MRTVISYWAVLGFAVQSGRLEQAMNIKLAKMGAAADRALEAEAAADGDTTLAAENESKSKADAAEGKALREEAEALALESEKDEALAAADQTAAEEMEAKAAQEQGQAVMHFGNAAADEALAQEEFATATAEAAAASRDSLASRGDGIGTGICEFIPFLDVVCDFIGGTAAVGLQAKAADEAAEAAAGFAAAAAAQEQEEAELAIAGEFQAKAAKDSEAAVELEAEAFALETRAGEEAAEAEKDEALAEEKFAQSVAEQEAAEEETAQAEAEQVESASAWEESMMHGLGACWNLIGAVFLALGALVFFAFRVTTLHLVPGARFLFFDLVPSVVYKPRMDLPRRGHVSWFHVPWRIFSFVFLHCSIFLLTAGSYGNLLSTMDEYSMRGRGGVILLFSATAAGSQGFLMHSMPHVARMHIGNKEHCALDVVCQAILVFLRNVIWLVPFFAMEVLILWVNFGHEIFSPSLKSILGMWYFWLVLVIAAGAHLLLFELNATPPSADVPEAVVQSESSPLMGNDENSSCGTESHKSYTSSGGELSSVSLDEEIGNQGLERRALETESQHNGEAEGTPLGTTSTRQTRRQSTTSVTRILFQDLGKLRLPFEVLIMSCMVALLRRFLPNSMLLWPLFKTMVVSVHPSWLLALVSVGAVALFCFVLWIMM